MAADDPPVPLGTQTKVADTSTDEDHAAEAGHAAEAADAAPLVRKGEDTLLASHMSPDSQPGTASDKHRQAVLSMERYEALRLLGSGAFGEVWRVRDHKFARVVAMKIVRPDVTLAQRLRTRFLSEIHLTAGLQHPGIVAVHDFGELADGRLWFTMREVRGRTLREAIKEANGDANGGANGDARGNANAEANAHAPGNAAASASGAPAPFPRAKRRLVDLFARVCETMAYAHSQRVIHRDLKPANIMVGEFGEVVVMDWGIARRIDQPPHADSGPVRAPANAPIDSPIDSPIDTPIDAPIDPIGGAAASPLPDHNPELTRQGDVLGTPAYMAPEQARGEIDRHGPTADVYSLGAILFHILIGRPPYTSQSEWKQALQQATSPWDHGVDGLGGIDAEVPDELAAICARAMAPEPNDRYADAGALAGVITAWLDGARRRERALDKLQSIMPVRRSMLDKNARAAAYRAQARSQLAALQPSDPVEAKAPGWALEDQAAALEREAALAEAHWLHEVYGALAIEPDLPEAHAALADHYCDRLLAAERDRHHPDAARFEVLLRAHARGRHGAIVSGHGALSLVTDPAGACVTLYRYVLRQRRLVPELVRELGTTPLCEVSLERGSYLLTIKAPGHIEVHYPVLIERGDHWHGCLPHTDRACPVPLPPVGALAADELYIPPGWTWIGGDPDAADGLARRKVWIDGFVIGRFPVTNGQYVAFLNDLVGQGRTAEALAACPRAHQGMVANADEVLCYPRDTRGYFVLSDEFAGERWTAATPAVLMNWQSAMAYARWRGEESGRPYRLANELEREKAVRGVDGRLFPWGNHFDPTWACTMRSHRDRVGRVEVDSYPSDSSPYGVRGGGGNVRDWCGNLWTANGPTVHLHRLQIEPAPADGDAYRAVRGGAWSSEANLCRPAARFANRPGQRRNGVGLRVAYTYPSSAT